MNPASVERKEIIGLHRITKKVLRTLCKKHQLYQTPELNDVLYLHYQGFQYIECLEEYTELKCLWLECNAISEIQGLENQTKLKCLFLQNNLIKTIENLENCKELDTLNLASNHIRKIENCGADVLPVLNTLNLSSNCLRDSESLRGLEECKTLSVLDLANNRIDDILVVKVFAKMPQLRVLVLQGNPVVSKIPQYRKTLILECQELTYLDSRPVFPKDRACAEAWKLGGYNEERKEQERWNRRDRKKIRDSVNATIRMRNKYKSVDEQMDLITSSDSETDEKRRREAKEQQKQGNDPRLLIETGEDVNEEAALLEIWDEVRGQEGVINKVENIEEEKLVKEDEASIVEEAIPNFEVQEPEKLEIPAQVNMADILKMVEKPMTDNAVAADDLPELVSDAESCIQRKRMLVEEISDAPNKVCKMQTNDEIPEEVVGRQEQNEGKLQNKELAYEKKRLFIEQVNNKASDELNSDVLSVDEQATLTANGKKNQLLEFSENYMECEDKKPLWVDEIFSQSFTPTSIQKLKTQYVCSEDRPISSEIEKEIKQGAIKKRRPLIMDAKPSSGEFFKPADKSQFRGEFDLNFDDLDAPQPESADISDFEDVQCTENVYDKVYAKFAESLDKKNVDETMANEDLEALDELIQRSPLIEKSSAEIMTEEKLESTDLINTSILDDANAERTEGLNTSPSIQSKNSQSNFDSDSELSNASDDLVTDTSSDNEDLISKNIAPKPAYLNQPILEAYKNVSSTCDYEKSASSESEDEIVKSQYNDAANAICAAVMSRVGAHEQPSAEKISFTTITDASEISIGSYEPESEMEKILERLPDDEAEERAKRLHPGDEVSDEVVIKREEEIKYEVECEEVNRQVTKDFETLNANMEFFIEQFQQEQEQIKGEFDSEEKNVETTSTAKATAETKLNFGKLEIPTDNADMIKACGDHVGIGPATQKLPFLQLDEILERPTLKAYEQEAIELKALLHKLELQNEKLTFVKKSCDELLIRGQEVIASDSEEDTTEDSFHDAEENFEDNMQLVNAVITEIVDDAVDKGVFSAQNEKPRNYVITDTDLESDEEYSYSGPPKPAEPPVKSIQNVLGAFHKLIQDIATENRAENQRERFQYESKRKPTTVKTKLESLQTLLETPSLMEHHKDSYEELKPQVDAVKERNKDELKQMVERVYAQKNKYDNSLEVVDGRLMVIEKETGEVKEMESTKNQEVYGNNESDESTEEYESAHSSNECEIEGRKKESKSLIWDFSMGAMKPHTYVPKYRPTMRMSAEQLILNALESNEAAAKLENQAETEDEDNDDDENADAKTLRKMDSKTSVFSNIDEEFFKNLDFKKIAEESAKDEHFVEIARSYEDLKKMLKNNDLESARSTLTDEEQDIVEMFEEKTPETIESNSYERSQDEDALMHKLVQRTKVALERGEEPLDADVKPTGKAYVIGIEQLKALEQSKQDFDSDQETLVDEVASNKTLTFDDDDDKPAEFSKDIRVVKMLKKLKVDDPIAQDLLKDAKIPDYGDFTTPLEADFERISLGDEISEDSAQAIYAEKLAKYQKAKLQKQLHVPSTEVDIQCEPSNFSKKFESKHL